MDPIIKWAGILGVAAWISELISVNGDWQMANLEFYYEGEKKQDELDINTIYPWPMGSPRLVLDIPNGRDGIPPRKINSWRFSRTIIYKYECLVNIYSGGIR